MHAARLWYDDLSYSMGRTMATVKVAITLDSSVLQRVDALVARRVFPSRSRAIQVAVTEKLARLEGNRLATECSKLDPREEQAMADETLGGDSGAWPEY
jgi:Arc/MetJ-type ribon-helix-helix transcriptional regulator